MAVLAAVVLVWAAITGSWYRDCLENGLGYRGATGFEITENGCRILTRDAVFEVAAPVGPGFAVGVVAAVVLLVAVAVGSVAFCLRRVRR